jgi:protein O-mannosyl-transferase
VNSPPPRLTRERAAGLVFLLALLLYVPGMWNGFAYDDNLVILLDSRIHDLSSPLRIALQPYWLIDDLGLYRPVPTLSYAVDWALSGGRPAWFHAVNALWNAAASLLVFLLLCRLAPVPAAFAGALVFAAHPVHAEAVANIVGRAELMAAVFSLGAMVLWLRTPPDRPPGARTVVGIAVLYALALLAKESAVMLPVLLALCDIARGALQRGHFRPWLRRNAGAFVAVSVALLGYITLRYAVLGGMTPGVVDPLLDVADTPTFRILTALQAWPEIARLLVFPRVLLADYGPPYMMPAFNVTAATGAGALILLGSLAGGTLAFLRGWHHTAFVLLFVPVALLPISNLLFPIGVIVAERVLYLPSLAIAAAVAFSVAALTVQTHRQAALGLAVVVSCIFAARTLQRIPEWDSTDVVLAALERDVPGSYRANWHAAIIAAETRQPEAALQHYATAVSTWPYRRALTFEAAAYAAGVGDAGMAAGITGFAIGRWPDDVGFLRLHAAVLLDAGQTGEARQLIERGLEAAPADSTLQAMLSAIAALEATP